MIGSIPHAIEFRVCHVVWMTMWYAFFAMWYVFFQKHRKLQFRILEGLKCWKQWHIEKTKYVWCMVSYYTHWEPSCSTLNQSHVALFGTQLVEYDPTHHTIIWFSLKRSLCHAIDQTVSCFLLSHWPMCTHFCDRKTTGWNKS